MLVNYGEVPKARECNLLQRRIGLRIDRCDVLGDGSVSTGYRYPGTRWGEPYTVIYSVLF